MKRVARGSACLLLWSALLPASFAQAPDAPAGSARELYQKGQYEAASARGLTELLNEPWNHELRFLVADSLQRSGKAEEAASQFEALEGTPYADSASLRMNALRPSQPPRRLTGPAAVRRTDVVQAAPQYQYAAPDLALPRQASPAAEPRRSVYTLIDGGIPAGPSRSPGQQEIHDLSAAGDYAAAGTRGLALFARETPSDETRLIVANSLAWTGRLKDAIEQYQLLMKGKFSKEATVGLANIYRWRGRDDQALPMYRKVLAADPENAGAREGVELAQRELQPRTLVTAGASRDSGNMQRRALAINQRWRDDSGRHIFEVETSGVNDSLPPVQARQRDVKLRYQALNLPLQPRFELEAQAKPDRAAFGGVKVKLGERQAFISVDRLNWGKLASNPNALRNDLAATHVGIEASGSFKPGVLGARIDYYDISDGNTLLTNSLNFTPAWRPLGSHVKHFIGIETRDVKWQSPNYWSPAEGFGTAYTGLLAEWGSANWNLFGSGQVGTRLYGEAGTSWSLSAGGRLWFSKDMALGMNLWNMSSHRDGAPYRAKAMNMSLETIWN